MSEHEAQDETQPAALTVGGSDCAGCAGIQVDLRVFARLGVFGTSVVTAVTAQTVEQVTHVEPVAPRAIQAQLEAALSLGPAAIKTGMLFDAATVLEVVLAAGQPDFPAALVVDPVLASSSGAQLLDEAGLEVLCSELLPQATLVTPNLDEAGQLLGGRTVRGQDELEDAARELAERFGCAVLLKGGHLAGAPVDLLWSGGRAERFEHPRVETPGLVARGTGCTLSAAITARLALGDTLEAACAAGIDFTARALANPLVLAGGLRLPGIERA
jgi:hydroxymethylpyrimidine kinase/phosphomethylpyrimidine kinase